LTVALDSLLLSSAESFILKYLWLEHAQEQQRTNFCFVKLLPRLE
jgi:hypothetical protein